MANKKNDPNHLGFGRLMAWKSSDIAMAGLNVIVLGYLSIYCSDTLGIAPAVVGTVLMVSKIIDAFTDIFAGWLVDNTHTKLGKGRPYELAIVGVMLCSLGLFSGSPAWSNTLKVVWIFCMYTLVFSIFTTLRGAANTPYTIRHFSNNPILIRKVASYGGIITMAGSMIVSILFPIVMSKLATSAGGWRTTVAIFVLPLLLISLLRFFFCKEDPSVDGGDEQFQPVRLNEIFSMFRRNKYVWLYAIIMLCYNISTSLAVTTYYFKYIIGNTAMMSVTSIFSIVLLPLMLVFPWIMKKIGGMSKMVGVFACIGIVGYIIVFVSGANLTGVLLGGVLGGLAGLPLAYYGVLFIMNCCTYNEMIGLPRMDGSAGILANFMGKCGGAMGSFITGIAGKKGFSVITIAKTGMSGDPGTLVRILEILAKHEVNVEYIPSGIDIISLVVESKKVSKCLYAMLGELQKEVQPNKITVTEHIAVVAAVGRKMAYRPGVSGKIFAKLGENGVNIRMITQGPEELNIIVGVEEKDFAQAIRVLYDSFVKEHI